MEYSWTDEGITFERILSPLDEMAISFAETLEKHGVAYAFMSGYVAILFGRSRSSEDIDLFMEKVDERKFMKVWDDLMRKFECLATSDPEEAYREYLTKSLALRFAKPGKYIPNIEVKFPKMELDHESLSKRIKVTLNKKKLYISPLEIQVIFKLGLGTKKDIEDARYVYKLFKDRLDKKELRRLIRKLEIPEDTLRYLDDKTI